MSTHRHDLLVIGGGPAGAAAAYWAADHGLDVVFVEKKRFPREKTCGDGLTPRASPNSMTWGWPTASRPHIACAASASSPTGAP